ncbi:hypothetical protein [Burkholderia mayonis]|uniref:hypothetical protein n=1 Tax=Burkholderia mayonis TaxID=1385591 RepID=UPI00131F0B99|nr:hypothetical protein [Burkholderia mayonis]
MPEGRRRVVGIVGKRPCAPPATARQARARDGRAARAACRAAAPAKRGRSRSSGENSDEWGKMLSLMNRCGEFRPPGRLRVKSHFTDLLAFPHESSEIRS